MLFAQVTAHPPVAVISNPSSSWACYEPAVAVNRTDPSEIVTAAIRRFGATPDKDISCCISMNGGTAYTTGVLLPPSCLDINAGGDPMVAFSSVTADVWIGGPTRSGVGPDGFYIARKPNDSAALVGAAAVARDASKALDKQLMAYGPDLTTPGAPDRMFVVFNSADLSGSSCVGRAPSLGLKSSDALGEIWPTPSTPPY